MEQRKVSYLILILLSLTLSLQLEAQTTEKAWFVDKNATGLNDGTNWNNAWKSFSNINWNLIKPGNTIFISGGTDSTVYNETLTIGASGKPGKFITITKGLDQGHNGIVIIDGQDNTELGIVISKSIGLDYLRISNITLKNHNQSVLIRSLANVVYLDSLKIRGQKGQGAITINGWNSVGDPTVIDSVFIRYCDIRSDKQIDAQTDNIFVQYANNTFILNNHLEQLNIVGDNHIDCIQTTNSLGNYVIANNFIRNDKLGNSQGMMLNSPNPNMGYKVIIYNNVMICVPICVRLSYNYGKATPGNTPIRFYNNTCYNTSNSYAVSIWDTTAIIKNNIIISGGVAGAISVSEFNPKRWDYNLYNSPDSRYAVVLNNLGINKDYWQGIGGDLHTLFYTNPLFKNINVYDLTLQQESPALYAGINLKNEVESWKIDGVTWNDNRGIIRGDRPSIGAYEYKAGTVNTDNTPPTLVSASVINPTSIVLTFSEPLELTSAQAKLNYSINNGININSAVLSSDGKKVTLNTTTNSANQTYTVVVSNIKDLAGNVVASSGNSASYSFTQTSTGDLKANVKVFLEGPLDSNVMLTELSGNEFLPSAQPYNTSPWFYGGKEVLGSGISSATDWVLVELHNAQDPSQIVAKRACLLRNDGRIIEPNGTLGVTFNNLFYGSYYIAVRHRNHLAVMSSSPVSFSPNNDLYDFTTSVIQAYGQNAMMQIAPGVYAMYAGDGNGDGIIDDKDRDDLWNSQNGNMGYLNGDFNLDSGVTVKDINDFWNINHDKKTQVP